MNFDFPTESDIKHLEKGFPFQRLTVRNYKLRYCGNETNPIINHVNNQEILVWSVHLQNRLIALRYSYIMLMYFFSKGIPDDEWYQSPGYNGASVQYYPHFSEADHINKSKFDFYSDAFFIKLYSAWDNIGHILNSCYGLNISKPSFLIALKAIKTNSVTLHDKLEAIINTQEYKDMVLIRHNIVHNHLPGHISNSFIRTEANHITMGIGDYVASAKIQSIANKNLYLLADTLNILFDDNK